MMLLFNLWNAHLYMMFVVNFFVPVFHVSFPPASASGTYSVLF